MKISEKAALAMAGYTKAEIEAMDKPAQPTPAAVQNPAIPQQVPPLAAPPAKQIVPQPAQPSGQYDGLEALLHHPGNADHDPDHAGQCAGPWYPAAARSRCQHGDGTDY